MTAPDSPTKPTSPPHGGSLGLVQGTALYIAAVLGTGILVLPGLAAEAAGPASIVAVAAVLVLSIPLAGTFAALASRYPDPGGVASYVRRTLGDTAARMTGYWFFFGVCIGAPGARGARRRVRRRGAGVDRAWCRSSRWRSSCRRSSRTRSACASRAGCSSCSPRC